MKKTLIVLLILAIAGGAAFGQVSFTLGFNLDNANNANQGPTGNSTDAQVDLIWNGAGSQAVGPGNLHFALQLGFRLHFLEYINATTPVGAYSMDPVDMFGNLGYGFGLGPGTLDFTLGVFYMAAQNQIAAIALQPHVSYSKINLGIVTLGAGVYYNYYTDGFGPNGQVSVFGRWDGTGTDKIMDKLAIWFSTNFAFGLGFRYEFSFTPIEKDIFEIANVDLNFTAGSLKIGCTLDETGRVTSRETAKWVISEMFQGFQVKPYINVTLNDNMALGAFVRFRNINNTSDMWVTPGLTFKYTL
ncbi:MAG: hypothetical protein FWG27_02180 [Treponema sp.]|nr:hypothetical protein [Treponema sp.]